MNQTQKKRLTLSLLPPLAALCIRFGPLLFGLEWRISYRGVLSIVTAVVLIAWIVVWFVLTKKSLWCLLAVPAGMLAVGLTLSFTMSLPPSETREYIVEQDGATYVAEIENGSLSHMQFYPFVNEVFRGLAADYDARRNWGT